MGKFDGLAIFTTTLYDGQTFSQVREELALRTFENAQALGIRTIVVDGGSHQGFLNKLGEFSVIELCVNSLLGTGASRRAALMIAMDEGTTAKNFLWVEPEKFGLITEDNLSAMLAGLKGASIVVPKRKSMVTLPKMQEIAERCANHKAAELMLDCVPEPNEVLDLWFGPKMVNRMGATFFRNYRGKPDKWDAIIVPVLQAYRDEQVLRSVEVDFEYDESQRNEEENDLAHQIRRFEQYRLIINACETAMKS